MSVNSQIKQKDKHKQTDTHREIGVGIEFVAQPLFAMLNLSEWTIRNARTHRESLGHTFVSTILT